MLQKAASAINAFFTATLNVTESIFASLKVVLDEAVLVKKFTNTRPLQSRVFNPLCENMGRHQATLLLHTDVRWLSLGNILVRMVELRKELMSYFHDYKLKLSDIIRNNVWLSKLIYLAALFKVI